MTRANLSLNKHGLPQKEILRHRKVPVALAILVMAMFYIVGTMLLLISGEEPYESLQSAVRYYFNYRNSATPIITGLFGVYFGLEAFRYLHVPRQVDFYESQPISRRARYIGITVNSLLTFSVIYLVFFLVGLTICAAAAAGANVMTNARVWQSCLNNLLTFSAWYGIATLSMMVTGNSFVAGLATIFFSCFELGVLFLYSTFFSSIAHTAGTNDYGWQPYTNPWSQAFNSSHWLGISLNLLWTVLYLGLAYWAYQKRANEKAGRAVAFAWIEQAVKIILVIFFAAFGGILGYLISGNNFVCGILGAVIIGLLTASIMEVIFKFDLAAWKNHFGQGLLLTVVGLVIFIGMHWGGRQFDNWLPASDQVASVAIAPDDRAFSAYYIGQSVDSTSANEYAAKYMYLPASTELLQLAKAGSKQSQKMDHGQTTIIQLRFLFRMKNGQVKTRVYNMREKDLDKYFEQISKTKAYKRGYFQIYHDQMIMDKLGTVSIAYKSGKKTVKLEDGKLYSEFRKAYKQDLAKWDYKLASRQKPVGRIRIDWAVTKSDDATVEYPVYANYSHTIAFLKKNKLYDETPLKNSQLGDLDYYINEDY